MCSTVPCTEVDIFILQSVPVYCPHPLKTCCEQLMICNYSYNYCNDDMFNRVCDLVPITNISLKVAQLKWEEILSDPMSLFGHCLCMAQLLKSLGSAFDSSTGDDICVDEEAESGVGCIPACFTNNTCISDTCPPLESGHKDVCSMFVKNQTSEFADVRVINVGLDCRTISKHAVDICSSILGERGNMYLTD